MAMPKSPDQLHAWYDRYNENVKKRMVIKCNRRYGRKFQLNMSSEAECKLDAFYIAQYLHLVGFSTEYKHECTDKTIYYSGWLKANECVSDQLLLDAKRELHCLKKRLLALRRRRAGGEISNCSNSVADTDTDVVVQPRIGDD